MKHSKHPQLMKRLLKTGQWVRELQRLDWRHLNKKTQRPFLIGLSGSQEERKTLQELLVFFDHSLRERFSKKVEETPSFSSEHIKRFFVEIPEGQSSSVPLLFELCLSTQIPGATPSWPRYQLSTLENKESLLKQCELILEEHHSYAEALSYAFPLFRSLMLERVVSRTVTLNTAWVTTTALPNIVPGAHQLMTIPFEASSDFVVLTFNELRMMMELTGLCGIEVRPRELFTQAVMVLSMAKIAQMSATQILSKAPAGAGVVVKGAVAFAFTKAMGEAVILYLITGRTQGKDFFIQRIDHWYRPGMDYIKRKLGKKE